MIKIFVETENGRVRLNNVDWKWCNAAGWSDIYTGQRIKGVDTKGNEVVGIAHPDPPRHRSTRPSNYATPADLDASIAWRYR